MSSQFPHPFRDLLKKFIAYRKELPMKVSGIAEEEFKGNFIRQGFETDGGGVEKWQKRKAKRKNDDDGHAILIKSGRLRKGFKKKPDFNTARVINDVPYAQIHNEGGTINHPARTRVLNFRKKRSGRNKGRVRFAKEKLAQYSQKVHSGAYKITMPQRPFMKTTSPLINKINKTVEEDVQKIYNSL